MTPMARNRMTDCNLAEIMKTAEALPHLNALIVVNNGTNKRMGLAARNLFTRLRGSIPDVVLGNVLVVLTNCDGLTKKFQVKTLEKDLPGVTIKDDTWFCMQNSAFSTNPKEWVLPANAAAFERVQSSWKVRFDGRSLQSFLLQLLPNNALL